MIFQFSLYGFLKNLRFFEAFLLLFLRDKGMSFTEIGLLFAFKELLVNLLNIPTGAIADLYGRKRSLIAALIAYIFSFLLLTYANNFALFLTAFFLLGIGESFRSGTHKAMIFDYLRQNNRLHEKTLIYGITRSWSQRGSAVSVLIGAAIVYWRGSYQNIFLYSTLPYLLGIFNILLYPASLEKRQETGSSLQEILQHLLKTTRKCWHSVGLRHLILQSSLYEGQYRSVKDYLQILIGMMASSLTLGAALCSERKTAILIALVYFVLYILSSYASKYSHKFLKMAGSEDRAIGLIFLLTAGLLLISAWGVFTSWLWVAIIGFTLIFNLQNIIRPIMTARYDDLSESAEQATILSIESQANSVGLFLLAPIVGLLADHASIAYAFILCAILLLLYLGFHSRQHFKHCASDINLS